MASSANPLLQAAGGSPFMYYWLASALAILLAAFSSLWRYHQFQPALIYEEDKVFQRSSLALTAMQTSLRLQAANLTYQVEQRAILMEKQLNVTNRSQNVMSRIENLKENLQRLRQQRPILVPQ